MNLEPDTAQPANDLKVVEFTDDQGVLQRLEKRNGKWEIAKPKTNNFNDKSMVLKLLKIDFESC